MQYPCVSLDLETTGLDPETDAITEIGAVKFLGEEVLGTFQTLVNPHRPIPYFIQILTGIRPENVEKAPSFPNVAGDLISFIGSCPVVGQNIPFDLGFLAAKGVELLNPFYDTLELANILLPSLPEHGLFSLAKALGVPTTPRHRALADAIAAKDVFLALLLRAAQLSPTTLKELNRLAAKSSWPLRQLLISLEESKSEVALSGREVEATQAFKVATRGRPEPLIPTPQKALLDVQQLTDLLKTTIAQGFPNFEHRTEQVRMTQAVAEALNQDRHLLVEAGTGTGKSLAYLLPCFYFALRNNTPVVISTNTINLQEQLMNKDIPDLLRTLSKDKKVSQLKALQLKGRSNYLCLRRLALLRRTENLSLDETKLLMRLLVWLDSTGSGDKGELNLSGDENATWNKVCSQADSCLAVHCHYYEEGTCFFYRARWAAEGAHLIIVNHALLLSDMVSPSNILPDYQYLIIDESHNLEKEATEQLGFKVAQRDLIDYLGRLAGVPENGRPSSLFNAIATAFVSSPSRRSSLKPLPQPLAEIERTAQKASGHAAVLFGSLATLVEHHSNETGEYDLRLRLTRGIRCQPDWSDIEITWENLRLSLHHIESKLGEIASELDDLEGALGDHDDLKLELSALASTSSELRRRLDSIISAPDPNNIYWAQLARQSNAVTLSVAPLHVGPSLEKHLFLQKASVILTSATLTTEGTFEHIKERLTLPEAQELLVGSPFDYTSAALIYLPQDIPPPNSPSYPQAVARVLIDLGRAVQGRTLALFTSHAALRATLLGIQAPLEKEGILVLGQGVDGSPRQLLNMLKANPRTLVLGTSSLWEGIDVVGEALSVLVIAKLPFMVPTDPVFAARSELLDDSFNQYAVPQAVLRFKQGFGRLIRSRTDRGVVVILDRRIQSKPYGAAFLDSLPLCTTKRGPADNLPAEALSWLARGTQSSLHGLP